MRARWPRGGSARGQTAADTLAPLRPWYNGSVLRGRENVLENLVSAVNEAAEGRGGVRWISGEAGVGKTALLDEFVERIAENDGPIRVLRAYGREGEAPIGWAGLQQVLTPLVGAGYEDSLPTPQRDALWAALALDAATAPAGSELAPVVGARALLAVASRDRPVAVVVDDAHWLDDPSLSALSFIAARITDHPIVLVVAGRPVDGSAPPCPTTVLRPLGDDDAKGLLGELGVSDPVVAARVVDQVGGTPLLLRAAVDALDAHQRAGRAPLPDVIAMPPSVGRLADERLACLDPASRLAALVAATAPDGDLGVVAAALHVLGGDAHQIEPVEGAGIVEVSDRAVTFSHPALRSCAYHGPSAADRRRVHGAIASVLGDQVARAWHLGQAALGPDREAASELSTSGATLLQRHAPVEAARHLERAALLAPDPQDAAMLLRRAAEAMAETGRIGASLDLLERADALGHDATESVRREQLRLRLAPRGGAVDDTDEIVEQLRTLASEVADADPALAAELMLDTLPALVRAVRLDDIEQAAKEAVAHADRAGDDRLARRGSVVLGGVQLARGDPNGAVLLDRHVDVLADEGAVAAGTFLAEVVAPSLGLLSRGDEALALFDTLEADLRAAGAIPALVVVLAARAVQKHGTDLRHTIALDLEAIELADAIGQPELGLHAAGSLAVAAAVVGDRSACHLAARHCAESPHGAHQLAGLCGRAVLHLGYGELDEALCVYGELHERFGVGSHVVRWEPEWCEALVRARRRDEAVEALDELCGTPAALLAYAGIERVRGLLAEDEGDAGVHFQNALGFYDLLPNDVARGRTELLWGERLRRARRRAEARVHLDAAVCLLKRVGADVWAQRAERELAVTGGTVSDRPPSLDALSRQELEIARLAVKGASNREIADHMFLSHRTVETHLSGVYRKLGVKNRRGLLDWAQTNGALTD